ncbi:BtrH N-terminal domain-containing protein [Paenibacillus tarimensis]|uniref:BtrH N-terminal domain-containing protein n=1 Tax=Paenibacillus tarimensis TaxID=416012 RepID=UPI001F22894F|nr:BtrH N-terminal domain-containing protein [Paenibacillus tarimensis]MCF2945149.1 BtrH N-terminal domain-containing protein [Paenibacillus tarimensis]
MNKNVLSRPVIYTVRVGDSHFTGARPSLTYCLWGLLQYTELQGVTLEEVNGWTSHAFYLNIFEDSVHIAGPTSFAGEPYIRKALSNLGYDFKMMGFTDTSQQAADQAHQMIKSSVDKGFPVVAWDLFHPEFGLIYGYDDESRMYNALDKRQEDKLSYDQLGRGETGEIYIIAAVRRNHADKQHALRSMLGTAIQHGCTSGSLSHPIGPVSQGLEAYGAWITAFEQGTLQPLFNAYNTAVYAELRMYASLFLQQLVEDPDLVQMKILLEEAAGCYGEVYRHLGRLAELFPFPEGGKPHQPEQAAEAVRLLHLAREAEFEGLGVLKQLLGRMSHSTSSEAAK